MSDIQKRIEELEVLMEQELIKLGEIKGYLRAKEEFEKIALSCCCSGCTKHNLFLIGELNGEIHSVHGQSSEEVKEPHGTQSVE